MHSYPAVAVYDQEQGYLRNIHEANRAASAAMLSLMQKDLGLPAVLLVSSIPTLPWSFFPGPPPAGSSAETLTTISACCAVG